MLTKKKEIKRAKKYYKKLFKDNGCLQLGIICFDGNFRTYLQKIIKNMSKDGMDISSDQCLDMLLDYYKARIQYY